MASVKKAPSGELRGAARLQERVVEIHRLIPHPETPQTYIGKVEKTPKGFRGVSFDRAYSVSELQTVEPSLKPGSVIRPQRGLVVFRVQQDFLYAVQGVRT